MNIITRILVWTSRIGHCRGFGIQSPTDYQFVRYVVNEHWPYYAYQHLGKSDGWLKSKLGRLYLRLANWRQPSVIVDQAGAADYLNAGCRKAVITGQPGDSSIEMALLPVDSDCLPILERCADGSLVVVQDIYKKKDAWQAVTTHERATICFDLYYCGIVISDSHRTKQSYIINF